MSAFTGLEQTLKHGIAQVVQKEVAAELLSAGITQKLTNAEDLLCSVNVVASKFLGVLAETQPKRKREHDDLQDATRQIADQLVQLKKTTEKQNQEVKKYIEDLFNKTTHEEIVLVRSKFDEEVVQLKKTAEQENQEMKKYIEELHKENLARQQKGEELQKTIEQENLARQQEGEELQKRLAAIEATLAKWLAIFSNLK
jgi:membrane-bound lytic murein transglycosylase